MTERADGGFLAPAFRLGPSFVLATHLPKVPAQPPHKHEAVRQWLASHPGFRPHSTPTGASWLNLGVSLLNQLSTPEERRRQRKASLSSSAPLRRVSGVLPSPPLPLYQFNPARSAEGRE